MAAVVRARGACRGRGAERASHQAPRRRSRPVSTTHRAGVSRAQDLLPRAWPIRGPARLGAGWPGRAQGGPGRAAAAELPAAGHRLLRGAALSGLGVHKGDRVALLLPNCPQLVIAFFAVLRRGGIVVMHNPLYTVPELRTQLADCGARTVITFDRGYQKIMAAREGTDVEHVIVT